MAENHQFTLPDVGEGLTEAEIVKWHVAAGDTVEVNTILVEVETAKSVVELPSPHAGVIARLHADEGQTVDVGAVIVSFGEGTAGAQDESASDPRPALAPPPEAEEPQEQRQPVLVGYGPSRVQVKRRPRKAGYRSPVPRTAPSGKPDRPYAAPPVRLRAKELGVDLGEVVPTGGRGQITRTDLDTALARRSAAAPVPEPAETRTPVKGVRRATAEAMVSSAFTAPHVTEWVTVDVTESLQLLELLRKDRAFAEARLTPLVLIARATLSALRAHPEINAKWDAEANEIVTYRDVNLGVAAATPRGLLVPNIKAAQALSTLELCGALADLVTRARNGKTQPDEMARGTFTITNIGVFGVDGGTPILNPGEAGILCVGRIVRRPWEHNGEIELRSVCTLSLSFDHRLVDGQLGSQVLAHIARLLAQPSLALVH
ncbi:dihydrolipoamide acetyltransferase family protein [Amycolatopsis sp. NPDC047767]|uniref:dihydrolipoamide acetyltransferase family protein n=1 Tax=Amycolatopsis sp. NPDC047767 TaxID=3156765 RepID=UPI003456BCE5